MAAACKIDSDDHANCPICLGVYRSPKSLPCLHTFCQVCLDEYIVNLDKKCPLGNAFACPVCRNATNTPAPGEPPSTWAGKFPSHYALMSLLELTHGEKSRLCDPCKDEELLKKAAKFYSDCQEYLCLDCIEFLKKVKVTKGHKLGNVSSGSKLQTEFTICDITCVIHREKRLEYFCKDHDSLCCNTCAITDHRLCQEMVEIATEASSANSKEDAARLKKNFSTIKENILKVSETVTNNHSKLEKKLSDILAEVHTLRQKINTFMDAIQKKVMTEKEAIQKSETVYLSDKLERCSRLAAAVDGSMVRLDFAMKKGSKSEMFIIISKLQQQLKDYELMMKEENSSTRLMSVKLRVDPHLERFLESQELLKFELKEKTNTLSLPMFAVKRDNESLEAPCATSSGFTKRVRVVRCIGGVTLDNPDEFNECIGMAYLKQGLMVTNLSCFDDGYRLGENLCLFQDFRFESVLLNYTSEENDDWTYVLFPVDAHSVAVVDNGVLNIIEIRTSVKVLKSFPVDRGCVGFARINGGFVIAYRLSSATAGVSVLGDNGNEIKRFNQDKSGRRFRSFEHLAVNVKKDRIYQSCFDTDSVYCFGLDGTPFFTYKHDKLRCPAGMDVDPEDNLYICGGHSNNIHQLSKDGNLIRIVDDYLLCLPHKICLMSDRDAFVVSLRSTCRPELIRFSLCWK